MPKHDMEAIFRKKLEDFEPQHGDRWEQIAAALPEEKKRRAGFWLWFGTGMALLIGVVSVIFMDPFGSEQKLPVAQSEEGTPSVPQAAKSLEEVPTEVLPLTPRLHYVPSGEASEGETETRIQPEPVEQTDPSYLSDNVLDDPEEVLPIRTLDPEEFFTINEAGDTIRVRKNPPLVQNDPINEKRKYPFAENGKWAMGFGMGISSSYFDQRMPRTQGNTAIEQQGIVQRNQELRQKMEQPGIAFSQSLWIQFQPHYNWSFNTGISMVQTTQNLAFTIKSQVPDPYRGPADFPEAGTTGPSGQYLFPEDSILPGTGYTATNKYFSREIPFYVNYHMWINQKFQLQLSAGAAYRWVTGASVFFADIDNVGMIYMNGPEYYPGLRGTWNIQGGIALNYQINDYFSLNMMPGFQLALQSNIRHEHYVQQYQRQWGLQVRLSRKLGF
ncbi:MAG: hypothetical protein ACYC1Q_08755 [Bacteroidia bacterium]